MTEQQNKKQEYQERHRFWADKRISQLSFHNNLLLTIGIAVIGYCWSERRDIYTDLIIDIKADIDWAVLCFLLGLALSVVSVFAGFMLSLYRLYDLRLTANITLTRKRALDKSVDIEEITLKRYDAFDSLKSFMAVIWNYEKYNINKSDIELTEDFNNKFIELRQKARDIGALTWLLVKWQTLSMLLAFIFFVVTMAINKP